VLNRFQSSGAYSSITSFKHGSMLLSLLIVSALVVSGIWCKADDGIQLYSSSPRTTPFAMDQQPSTSGEIKPSGIQEQSLETMLAKRRGLLGRFTVVSNDLESLLDDYAEYDEPSIINGLIDLENAFKKYCVMHQNVLEVLTDLSHVSRLNAKHHAVTGHFQSLSARAKSVTESKPIELNQSKITGDVPDQLNHSAMVSIDRTGVFDRDDSDEDRRSLFSSAFSKFSSAFSIRQAKTALAKAKAKADFQVRMAQINLEDAMGVEEELASTSSDESVSRKLGKKAHQTQPKKTSDRYFKTSSVKKVDEIQLHSDENSTPKEIDVTSLNQLRPTAPEWVPQHYSSPSCMQSPLALAPMLPRPELLSFDGNPTEFIAFRQSFLNYIDSQPISSSYKLGYLLQYCTGEAKAAIQDCIVLPEEGYEEAWRILSDQFGRPHVIAKAHLDALLHGPAIQMSDPKSLITLARKMKSCEMALSDDSFSANLNSENTLNEIAMRLPKSIRIKWVEKAAKIQKYRGVAPRFHDLLEFIRDRADICSSSFADNLLAKDTNSQQPVGKTFKPKSTLATTAESPSKQPNNPKQSTKCVVCSEDHYLPFCDRFIKMPLSDRLKIAKDENLCFNCLRKGHSHTNCPKESFCKHDGCQAKHSKFLHREVAKKKPTVSGQEAATCHYSHSKNGICLQVVPCLVKSKGSRTCQVYALLDQCSNVSLCTDALISKLGIQGKPSAIQVNTVSGFLESEVKEISLTALDMDCNVNFTLRKVYSVPKLPFTPESIPLEDDLKRWPHLKDLTFPSVPVEEISLLIGADHPGAFKVLDVREGFDGDPYGVRYPLGWTVIGP